MLNKKAILILMVVVMVITFVGCNTKEINVGEEKVDNIANEEQVRIGMIVGTGGLGDQSFNDIIYAGLTKARDEFDIVLDHVEIQSVSDYETVLSQFAEDSKYDLIVVSSFEATTALEKIAPQFPNQKFSIIDTYVDLPNVRSIEKDFADMTFLSGVLAAHMTIDTSIPKINENNVIGMILGGDFPTMGEAYAGYVAGARYVDPNIEVLRGVVGSFADPSKGKEIATSMYNRDADIVLQFAGGSGLGVINAAVESDAYALGSASNQNSIAPKNVPVSAIENLKKRSYDEVKDIINGDWKPGSNLGGLLEDAVGLDYDGSEVEIPEEILNIVSEVHQKVIKGELEIPNTLEEIDDWLKNTN